LAKQASLIKQGEQLAKNGASNVRYLPLRRVDTMPARSKKQQMAAGAALAAKRGERSKSSLKGASKKMADSMSEKQLKDFAKTTRKKLPTKRS
jgi:hypothetical protein